MMATVATGVVGVVGAVGEGADFELHAATLNSSTPSEILDRGRTRIGDIVGGFYAEPRVARTSMHWRSPRPVSDNPAVGSFADVLRVLARMKAEGVVEDYAIGGAMAVSFWTEPVATQDLDVVVTLAVETHPLDPLRAVFDWLKTNGFPLESEHAMIAGVPVQFLVAWSALVAEAVETAQTVPYDPSAPDAPLLPLITPTYLVAMWQMDKSADTPRRRERAAMLREAGLVDENLLATLRSTYASEDSR